MTIIVITIMIIVIIMLIITTIIIMCVCLHIRCMNPCKCSCHMRIHLHLHLATSSYLSTLGTRWGATSAVSALDPKCLVARTKFTEEYFRARRKFSTSGEYCNLRRGRRFHWPIHADLARSARPLFSAGDGEPVSCHNTFVKYTNIFSMWISVHERSTRRFLEVWLSLQESSTG